jgi:hypothetical protein
MREAAERIRAIQYCDKLWKQTVPDYALRGIEAEAKGVVKILRDHQRQIEQTDTTVAWTEGQGYRYAAEAMKAQKPRRRTTTTPRVRKSIPPLTAINQKIIAAAKRAKPT